MRTDVGMKFFLLPFRDTVYLDLRRFDANARADTKLAWKIKDWGESTVLPHVFRSLNKVIPVKGVRYRLIDKVSTLTQGIVSNRLVSSGSISTATSGQDAASAPLFHVVLPRHRFLGRGASLSRVFTACP